MQHLATPDSSLLWLLPLVESFEGNLNGLWPTCLAREVCAYLGRRAAPYFFRRSFGFFSNMVAEESREDYHCDYYPLHPWYSKTNSQRLQSIDALMEGC